MPEKKKKGKGKGKGKAKGKGKKHHEKSGERHLVRNARGEMVPVNEFTLEFTLDATNRSLTKYKERMEGLISTNQDLQETCTQQEKDALDVIAALHAESEKKDIKIKSMHEEMQKLIEKSKQDQLSIINESDKKIQEMNNIIQEKESSLRVMQNEFSVIKDFRKKRQDLLKELDYLKQELGDTERQHKDTVMRMERKFFEEKIRLQKEANRKISELASKAHKEAVANLKDTTKEVYKENLRLAESLSFHVQEGEELAKQNKELVQANRQLIEEKDLHNVIVKEKILQSKSQSQEVKDLYAKIHSMEHSLSHVVREFEHEREIIGKLARKELDSVRKVAEKLRDNLERKTMEMKHIKRLAQHVLDQRTDLERFFMDALDQVREYLQQERDDEKRAARVDYNKRIRAVMKSVPFPAVQSFRPHLSPLGKIGLPPVENGSNNSATMSPQPPGPAQNQHFQRQRVLNQGKKVDINDLSWQDKERVLRLLFAKMNGIALMGQQTGQNHKEANVIGAEEQAGKVNRHLHGFQTEEEGEGRVVDIDEDNRDGEFIAPVEEGNQEKMAELSNMEQKAVLQEAVTA